MSITFSLSKCTKLQYNVSESRVGIAFELIHLDTWGQYIVLTRSWYRYLLTIVDDHTPMTWMHLMQYKSEFLVKLEVFFIAIS